MENQGLSTPQYTVGAWTRGEEGNNVTDEWAEEWDEELGTNVLSQKLAVILGTSISGGTLFLVLVIGFVYCYRLKRQQKKEILIAMHKKKTLDDGYKKEINEATAEEEKDPWQLDKSALSIDFDSKLGSGAFCNVFKGKINGEAPICKLNQMVLATAKFRDCSCAVKMLPSFADDIAKSDFNQEINFMKTLQYHPHLVSMLGLVQDSSGPLLLVEYCEMGDLLHYIRNRKEEIIRACEDNTCTLKIRDLVSFAWQISDGLEYLSSIGCIHRDIAARNVLVDSLNVCKIGDFGLCRMTNCLLYTGRGGRLPLKWMAPESLRSFEYSVKSDVWSYGVLLYELFSLGEVPYQLIETSDLLEYLDSGKRLEKPVYCPTDMYSIMLSCWEVDPSSRLSFSQLCTVLRGILESASENYGYVKAVDEDYGYVKITDKSRIPITAKVTAKAIGQLAGATEKKCDLLDSQPNFSQPIFEGSQGSNENKYEQHFAETILNQVNGEQLTEFDIRQAMAQCAREEIATICDEAKKRLLERELFLSQVLQERYSNRRPFGMDMFRGRGISRGGRGYSFSERGGSRLRGRPSQVGRRGSSRSSSRNRMAASSFRGTIKMKSRDSQMIPLNADETLALKDENQRSEDELPSDQ